MWSGKVMIIHLIWIDKKISLYKMSYFPKPYTYSKNWIDTSLSNYAKKF